MKKYLFKFIPIYFYLLPSCVTYDVNGNRKSYTLTWTGTQGDGSAVLQND